MRREADPWVGKPEQCVARQPVELASVLTLPNGEEFAITIIELSSSGCRVRSSIALKPGELVELLIGQLTIDAEVRWFSKDTAGLCFTFKSGLPTYSTNVGEGGRFRASIKASMQRHGKPRFEVRLIDISVHGCKVEFADRPDVGERVHMRFEGLTGLEEQVRWVAGIEAGIRFEGSIHAAVLSMLLLRSDWDNSC